MRYLHKFIKTSNLLYKVYILLILHVKKIYESHILRKKEKKGKKKIYYLLIMYRLFFDISFNIFIPFSEIPIYKA